jgi:hypothetical protein
MHWRTQVGSWVRRNFNSLVKQSAASEQKDMMEAPELRTHVFCRVTEDIGAVAVDDNGCKFCPVHVCFRQAALYDWCTGTMRFSGTAH